MLVSFISTFFNEESAIEAFLKSLFNQSRLPDEIVLVDGESTDSSLAITKELISEFRKYHKRIEVKIISKKGNRSTGRNEAIKNSTGEIIACSDVGCILDKNWLQNIVEPFKSSNVEVVSGYYKPITTSSFEKALATYTCVMPDKVNPKIFLPSSRSVAFKKKVWEEIGGYPENIDTCEDLVFARNLKRKGYHFEFVKSALVYWPQKKNFKEAFWQFFNYAKGDGQALYIRPQTPLLFARYFVGLGLIALYLFTKSNYLFFIIFCLFFLYLAWAVWKNYKYVKSLKALYLLPMFQFIADLAVIIGMTTGFLTRKRLKY